MVRFAGFWLKTSPAHNAYLFYGLEPTVIAVSTEWGDVVAWRMKIAAERTQLRGMGASARVPWVVARG
jgi:hypothetical protein